MIPSLETQLLELARSKLPELGQGFGSVREQEELPCRVESYLDCTVVNTVIDPVDREPEFAGDLGHCEIPWDLSRVRLTLLDEQAVPQANPPDGTDQHCRVARRAAAVLS